MTNDVTSDVTNTDSNLPFNPIPAPAGVRTGPMLLPNGTRLSLRSAGQPGAPVVVFLHGFPEAAFIWDDYLLHAAQLGYHAVAPNLRGFECSSAPADPAQYRAKCLVQDIEQLISGLAGSQALHALVAHDWGGAVAWNLANQLPKRMQRLCIVNSPHPGPFLRDLQTNPQQQHASEYMNFLARADAAGLLAAHNFERLWRFLSGTGEAPFWLTDSLKQTYETVWGMGLVGGCNYYRASPLRPSTHRDAAATAVQLPDSMLHINVPTHLAWGLGDTALLPCLLDGLDAHIPQLTVTRIPNATHWVLHEQPAFMQAWLAAAWATPTA